MPILCKYQCLYRLKNRTQCQFRATSLNSKSSSNLSPEGVVCTNDVVEEVFFLTKNFTLKEVTTTLRCSANEMPAYFTMPSDYTTDDTGAKSAVIKTSGKGKMQVTIMLTW
jgi:hypothetical protein